MGLLDKIKQGLSKTKNNISEGFNSIFANFRKVDEDLLDELLDLLLSADVGIETSETIIDTLRENAKLKKIEDADSLKQELCRILTRLMDGDNTLNLNSKPSIILVVGVNGVGKTTTIGKLANKFRSEGKSVMLVAADTFRAAAADQLEIWADRAKVKIVRQNEGADPGSVVYDALQSAKSKNTDVILIDTAGRLQNKKNLMEELKKITRIVNREMPDALYLNYIVLDATTGQNAIAQVEAFNEAVDIDGIILTKLDGTAKGGVVLAIEGELSVPVVYIGVGEGIDDLQDFDSEQFVDAIFD
jgi:fused signal recognition particle receptor